MLLSVAILACTLMQIVAFGPPRGRVVWKSTYSCSLTAATNAFDWMLKYFPVEQEEDDCPNRTCTCGKQSRVALKVSAANDRVRSPGFGLHCIYAAGLNGDRAAANHGMTQDQLEEHYRDVIGNWSTYNIDASVRAWAGYRTGLFATSGLDWYVTQFNADGIKYHAGSWQSGETWYWSVLVLIPSTPVVVELQGTCTLCGNPATKRMPVGYIGKRGEIPSTKIMQKKGAAMEQGVLKESFISRVVDNLDAVKLYYKSVFAMDPIGEATLGDGAQMVDFRPPGADMDIRYFKLAGQSGPQASEWFQQLLLNNAKKYQTSPDSCWPIWGDFHYGAAFSQKTILEYVTAAGKLGYPYRSFAGWNGDAYLVEPSGMWIQINGNNTGLPAPGGYDYNYCYSFCSKSMDTQLV